MTTSEYISSQLLEIEAIKLRPEAPFKWSSGWNSPIYCDNRYALSYPALRTFIKKALVEAVKSNFANVEAIAGVATAGIPQGALVADELQLPYLYVRPKPKEHGMGNMIEGRLLPGQKLVLIEDLISTGGSSLKAAEAVKNAGAEVIGMLAIFNYNFDIADKNFERAGIKLVCLTGYNDLIKLCKEKKMFNQNQLQSLAEWRANPSEWGK
jgi:orotate phosphoribosyltransferase